ncbi:MAG: nitrite/sulfite reductase [Acidobacteriota bacterium]|nr:nitrite/sulfite reductase [Acidobacteriota bacterium]
MAVSEDPRTYGRTRLSFAQAADIDEFVVMLDKFERGEITPDEWRRFRLLRGTYGQRQDADAQMLRVKIPQGILDAAHLEALADVAERYSRGFGHISTRQNVQFHFVALHDAEPAMRLLAEAGITTREACGNSVRNITACPYAGVARDEVFDVTPYAEAMTRYLLRHPLSSALPRKFKIAFDGCASEDHAATSINDLGWRAAFAPDGSGRRGFRLNVAGGTAIMCRTGASLYEFLPASDILMVAEAVLRVFQRYGDYEHKQRNRLKFLVKSMGWEAWQAAFQKELDEVRAAGGATLPFDPENPPVETAPGDRAEAPSIAEITTLVRATAVKGPGIVPVLEVRDGGPGRERTEWLRTNLRPQKQGEYSQVTVALVLGDITAGQMRAVAALSRAYADGTVRVTVDQNLVMRWVKSGQVPGLYRRLAAAGLAEPGAGTITDVTSCPGAESCRLAVTQSRGLARLIGEDLAEHPEVVRTASDVNIKISGCPNGCGQHHVASIGFQGSIRKIGERAVPQYFMMLGGGAGPGGASFGRLTAKIPARRIPEAVTRMLRLYQDERTAGETATAFFLRVDTARARAAVADLERMTAEEALPADFIDPGEDHAFSPEVMDGECAS